MALFSIGKITTSNRVQDLIRRSGKSLGVILKNHADGDFGISTPVETEMHNRDAIRRSSGIVESYHVIECGRDDRDCIIIMTNLNTNETLVFTGSERMGWSR